MIYATKPRKIPISRGFHVYLFPSAGAPQRVGSEQVGISGHTCRRAASANAAFRGRGAATEGMSGGFYKKPPRTICSPGDVSCVDKKDAAVCQNGLLAAARVCRKFGAKRRISAGRIHFARPRVKSNWVKRPQGAEPMKKRLVETSRFFHVKERPNGAKWKKERPKVCYKIQQLSVLSEYLSCIACHYAFRR